MKENKRREYARLAYLIVTIYWGLTAVLMRDVLNYMDSSAYVFLRFGVAGLTLAPVLFLLKGRIRKSAVIKGCIIGGILGISLQFSVHSLEYTKVSNSVFFANLSVIIVPLVQAVQSRRLPRRYWFAGAGLIVLGLYFLGGGSSFHLNFGDVLCLGSSALITVQILVISRFVSEDDPMVISVFQVLVASAVGLAGWGITSGFSAFILNKESLWILFLTGILGTAGAYTCQICAQKYADPTDIAMIGSLYPLFGAIGAVAFPDVHGIREPVTLTLVLGTVFVVLGLMLYSYYEMRDANR